LSSLDFFVQRQKQEPADCETQQKVEQPIDPGLKARPETRFQKHKNVMKAITQLTVSATRMTDNTIQQLATEQKEQLL